MRNAWVSKIVIVGLVGGFCLVGYGLGGTPAAAVPPVIEDALPGVTQNWDKNLPSASRFIVLADFNNEAVRDNNTGLVWEKAPNTTLRDWASATNDYVQKAVGGTFGWRLPSVVELKSLQNPSLQPPYVPSSVFDNVQSIQFPTFWTATTNAVTTTNAWVVQFWNHDVANGYKTGTRNVWCVRGPMNADTY
jgi:hypothetical protein